MGLGPRENTTDQSVWRADVEQGESVGGKDKTNIQPARLFSRSSKCNKNTMFRRQKFTDPRRELSVCVGVKDVPS